MALGEAEDADGAQAMTQKIGEFGAQHGVIFHGQAEETTSAPQDEPEKVHA